MVEYVTVVRPVCSEQGCARPQVARGLCITHYKRLWKAGLLSKKNAAGASTHQRREEARASGHPTG